MSSYVFNVARRGWTSNGGVAGSSPYPPLLPQWNSALGTYRMLLLGGGGATNGLDTAQDANTLADISLGQLLQLYEFNGPGYQNGGVTFSPGSIESYTAATDKSNVLVTSPITFPGLGFGTGGHRTITDILIYYDATPGTPNGGVPIVRFDLAATHIPQGATMSLTWANGITITIGSTRSVTLTLDYTGVAAKRWWWWSYTQAVHTRPWDMPSVLGREYKLMLFSGGGAANGLDTALVEDGTSVPAGVLLYQFNGAGYPANGIPLSPPYSTRSINYDLTNDRTEFRATDILLQNVYAGTGLGANITDAVLVYQDNGVPTPTSLFLARYVLGTYTLSATSPTAVNIVMPATGLLRHTIS